MNIGYARVSKSDDQDTAAQVAALKAAECPRIFEETASGGRWNRPELHRMIDQLREGDTVIVWKLDRLSRSLKDILLILEKIEAQGARFRSLTEAIDTMGPAGRMMMQMLGSFAEFERAMVKERTQAGLAVARARADRRTAAKVHAGTAPRNPGHARSGQNAGRPRSAFSRTPRYHQPARVPNRRSGYVVIADVHQVF